MNITMDDSDLNIFLYNLSVNDTLPDEMKFTRRSLVTVILYCIGFVIAAVGNLTVFVTLASGRYRKSRISLMICHLSAADLFVVFFMIPIETSWHITVQWVMGNLACKIYAFFRAFGYYLSNNILVCVSIDRYFAILHPLNSRGTAQRRCKYMLAIAWAISLVSALPQSFVFHTKKHPLYTNYTQCVTFDSFGKVMETVYKVFTAVAMYLIQIIIICIMYTKILYEICKKTQESRQNQLQTDNESKEGNLAKSNKPLRLNLRKSNPSRIERARVRTLKMTITIVAVFIICWTPYGVMSLWYIFDKSSTEKVPKFLQNLLFQTAIVNSCANPLVYGSYVVDLKKMYCNCLFPCKFRSSRLERRSTGTAMTIDGKSPGVSTLIVRKFNQLIRGQTRSTVVGGAMMMTNSPKVNNVAKPKMYNKLPLNEMQVVVQDKNLKATMKRSSQSFLSIRSIPTYQHVNEHVSA